jgi:hypothetical protein
MAIFDLHVHTKISDNSLTTEEVIKMARDKGITHLAITNHDTTKGLNEAMDWGLEFGVTVIPGIEISAYDYKRQKRAHILGLYIEPGHPALEELCAPLTENRNQASYDMVQRLITEGYDLDWEEVQKYAEGGTGVYKQHIMHALLDRGYCDRIYCELYKPLFRRGSSTEAPGLAYIPLIYADAAAAIRAVRESGGIPVLAHPGQLANFDGIDEWAEAGLEGIEAFHPSHSPEDVVTALSYAQKHNLIITGGSDFHGFYGEMPVELGCPELKISSINELILRKSARNAS